MSTKIAEDVNFIWLPKEHNNLSKSVLQGWLEGVIEKMTHIVISNRRHGLPNARRALKGRYAAKNRDERSEKREKRGGESPNGD